MENQWQLCPKCNGQGTVSKPPGVGGDVSQWTSDKPVHECDLCHGKKVIAPPDYEALKAEIKELKKGNEWVSIEERLPEKSKESEYDDLGYFVTEEILAIAGEFYGIGWFQIYTRDNKLWNVKKGDVKFKSIQGTIAPTHWRPLPTRE